MQQEPGPGDQVPPQELPLLWPLLAALQRLGSGEKPPASGRFLHVPGILACGGGHEANFGAGKVWV